MQKPQKKTSIAMGNEQQWRSKVIVFVYQLQSWSSSQLCTRTVLLRSCIFYRRPRRNNGLCGTEIHPMVNNAIFLECGKCRCVRITQLRVVGHWFRVAVTEDPIDKDWVLQGPQHESVCTEPRARLCRHLMSGCVSSF